MSKLSVARAIAQRTGATLSNAVSYVNRVGQETASATLRKAENGVSWKIPATVTAAGGTVYGWREQNIRKAEAIAERSNNSVETLQQVLDSGLTDEQKAELLEGFDPSPGPGGGGSGSGSGSGDPVAGISNWLGETFGGTETTLILTIVMVFVLIYGLNNLNPGGGIVR